MKNIARLLENDTPYLIFEMWFDEDFPPDMYYEYDNHTFDHLPKRENMRSKALKDSDGWCSIGNDNNYKGMRITDKIEHTLMRFVGQPFDKAYSYFSRKYPSRYKKQFLISCGKIQTEYGYDSDKYKLDWYVDANGIIRQTYENVKYNRTNSNGRAGYIAECLRNGIVPDKTSYLIATERKEKRYNSIQPKFPNITNHCILPTKVIKCKNISKYRSYSYRSDINYRFKDLFTVGDSVWYDFYDILNTYIDNLPKYYILRAYYTRQVIDNLMYMFSIPQSDKLKLYAIVESIFSKYGEESVLYHKNPVYKPVYIDVGVSTYKLPYIPVELTLKAYMRKYYDGFVSLFS